jgi:hypothetical protein
MELLDTRLSSSIQHHSCSIFFSFLWAFDADLLRETREVQVHRWLRTCARHLVSDNASRILPIVLNNLCCCCSADKSISATRGVKFNRIQHSVRIYITHTFSRRFHKKESIRSRRRRTFRTRWPKIHKRWLIQLGSMTLRIYMLCLAAFATWVRGYGGTVTCWSRWSNCRLSWHHQQKLFHFSKKRSEKH